jgi:hypothetical protein
MIFSNLPSPAEAGFAKAGNRCPLFGIMLYPIRSAKRYQAVRQTSGYRPRGFQPPRMPARPMVERGPPWFGVFVSGRCGATS